MVAVAQAPAIAVGDAAPLDVRLAVALMLYAASDVQMSEPKFPLQLSFTMYEDDCEAMNEVCRMANWNPKRWEHQRATLSRIACKLADYRYLERRQRTRNEEAMENGEPARWNVYSMPLKYRAKLNPTAWTGYKPDWPPVDELAFMLRRVFDYEGQVTEWREAAAVA